MSVDRSLIEKHAQLIVERLHVQPQFRAGNVLFYENGCALAIQDSRKQPLKVVYPPSHYESHRRAVVAAGEMWADTMCEFFEKFSPVRFSYKRWRSVLQNHDNDKLAAAKVIRVFYEEYGPALTPSRQPSLRAVLDDRQPLPSSVEDAFNVFRCHDLRVNHHLANWLAMGHCPIVGFMEHVVEAWTKDGMPSDGKRWLFAHVDWMRDSLASRDDLGLWLSNEVIAANLPLFHATTTRYGEALTKIVPQVFNFNLTRSML